MTPSIDRTLHQFLTITDLDLITEFDFLPNCARFPYNICNRCSMPTEDAYSSRHLVLSHFGTCMCSNVETNLSWTCLVSGLLNFEHPSVLLFCFAIRYLSSMLYVYRFLWPLRLGWLLVCCLYKEVYLQIFKRVSFWLHDCCGEWKGWVRKPG